ncbi:MAG: hypothetical protein K2X77_33355 [Candidatus Obscuribacterales bacterium]|nr:hypothetical protein [Candidatus Obscuribacterales bacterium]
MKMPRGLSLLAASIILTGAAIPVIAADARWAGYLLDRSCADNCKTQGFGVDFASSHKKECALNASCSKDGYALFSKGQWFFLDKKGNQLAKKLLEDSKSDEGHFVVVTGNLDKTEVHVSTMREVSQH